MANVAHTYKSQPLPIFIIFQMQIVADDPCNRVMCNMGKPGSSQIRDPPLISEESPLKSEAVLIKYLDFWDC